MKKLELLFATGWVMAGLLALRMVLPATATSRPLVETIRTQCALPAGTVVFVVRDRTEESP